MSELKRDFLIALAFLASIWIVWALAGGPQRAMEKYGIPDTPPADTDSVIMRSDEQSALPPKKQVSVAEEIERVDSRLSLLSHHLSDVADEYEPSPYMGMVTIADLSAGASAAEPATEYIVLRTAHSIKERVDITGWSLESARRNVRVPIPAAVALPQPEVDAEQRPLFVGANEHIIVATGRSPIGASFRTNTCTGYLQQFQEYAPPLKRSCPAPLAELRRVSFSVAAVAAPTHCAEYVRDIPACEAPLTKELENAPRECQVFATSLNYGSCVAAHQDTATFFAPEWRVFLNQRSELWDNEHDAIQLIDEAGRVVDVFTY